jgi:hypothetical protein
MHWSFLMHRDETGTIRWRWKADERALSYTSYQSYSSLTAALNAAAEHGLLEHEPNVLSRVTSRVRHKHLPAGRVPVKRTAHGRKRCGR